MTNSDLKFPENLFQFCSELEGEFSLISDERKRILQQLSHYIVEKSEAEEPIKIIVICTHNSRRSHIGQLWLKAASLLYGIKSVSTFSGGTEATAFNYRSVAALRNIGFEIIQKTEGENPKYIWNLDHSNELFSKKYESAPNPKVAFAAVMVCNHADKGCPFVSGTDGRFSIPFEDPKKYDDTELESQKYAERVKQIGREFLYVMHFAKERLAKP